MNTENFLFNDIININNSTSGQKIFQLLNITVDIENQVSSDISTLKKWTYTDCIYIFGYNPNFTCVVLNNDYSLNENETNNFNTFRTNLINDLNYNYNLSLTSNQIATITISGWIKTYYQYINDIPSAKITIYHNYKMDSFILKDYFMKLDQILNNHITFELTVDVNVTEYQVDANGNLISNSGIVKYTETKNLINLNNYYNLLCIL